MVLGSALSARLTCSTMIALDNANRTVTYPISAEWF